MPRKEIALVKTRYSYKLKAYAPRLLEKVQHTDAPIHQLVAGRCTLPDRPKEMTPKLQQQYRRAERDSERRKRRFRLQDTPIKDLQRTEALDKYIGGLTFLNPKLRPCHFTLLQQHDMGLLYQKPFSLLNWHQGSGKTAVLYHYGKYLLTQGKVKNVIVLAPALATNTTWADFLKRNDERYTFLQKPSDFDNIPKGTFVVVSISMLGNLKRWIKRYVKLSSNKLCLLFDESDEITNPTSARTLATLDLFRRLPYKMLATGTSTRNNITELYSQVELLYNNSVNMMCYSPDGYFYDRGLGEVISKINPHYGMPFPARGGHRLFKHCHCPIKTTVFGIEKQNQDIYNKEELSRLIGKTILTRSFREFAGDKCNIRTRKVLQSQAERRVYKTIMKKFVTLCNLYFVSIGDARKDAALKIVRQIQLLIKACSVPHRFLNYHSDELPRKVGFITKMIAEMPGKVAVGCTTLAALEMYKTEVTAAFPDRPVFIVEGKIPFKKRSEITAAFEATENGLLICTQQSLKSSVNIPSCNEVILEALQWNVAKMEQFYFRFIRLDPEGKTNVHFVTYKDTIEQNLMALILTKERLLGLLRPEKLKTNPRFFRSSGFRPILSRACCAVNRTRRADFTFLGAHRKLRKLSNATNIIKHNLVSLYQLFEAVKSYARDGKQYRCQIVTSSK